MHIALGGVDRTDCMLLHNDIVNSVVFLRYVHPFYQLFCGGV